MRIDFCFGCPVLDSAESLGGTAQGAGPDGLAFAVIVTAAAICHRLIAHPLNWPTNGVLLGLTLALGYAAKTVLLPAGILLLALALLVSWRARPSRAGLLVAFLVMAMSAAPLVIGISRAHNRLTIGDSGRLNYAWMINGITPHVGWTGTPGFGRPVHGPRLLDPRAKVLEFSTPIAGTYPLWVDPAWWYEGVRVRVEPARQVKRAFAAAVAGGAELFSSLIPFLAAAAALLLSGRPVLRSGKLLTSAWLILVFGMYCLSGQVQPRYMAGFVAIAFADALLLLSAAAPVSVRIAVFSMLAFTVLAQPLKTGFRQALASRHPASLPLSAENHGGEILKEAGVDPGQEIAVLSEETERDVLLLATAAGLRITSQIFEPDTFWKLDQTARADILAKLRNAGVRAVLTALPLPSKAGAEGWKPLPGTSLSYLHLPPHPAPDKLNPDGLSPAPVPLFPRR